MWLPFAAVVIGLVAIPDVAARDDIHGWQLSPGNKSKKIDIKKYLRLRLAHGAVVNRTHGLWLIGNKLRSAKDGVVIKAFDEMIPPHIQLFEYEDVGLHTFVGKLARRPEMVRWPWMDSHKKYLFQHLVDTEVQKIGPYRQPDKKARGWGIFGAPQLSQLTPCRCAWSPNCKFYYEVELWSMEQEMQIGWATPAMHATTRHARVGAKGHSWGADGAQNVLWMAGVNQTGALSAKWQENDVIGLAVDVDKGVMKWSLNGFWGHGPDKDFDIQSHIFPCLSTSGMFNMLIAKKSWRFSPPEEDYAPWTNDEHFVGSRPHAAEIWIEENGKNDVKVLGRDAETLGVGGKYSFSWDGVGSGEPYYKREGSRLSDPLYLYHLTK